MERVRRLLIICAMSVAAFAVVLIAVAPAG